MRNVPRGAPVWAKRYNGTALALSVHSHRPLRTERMGVVEKKPGCAAVVELYAPKQWASAQD